MASTPSAHMLVSSPTPAPGRESIATKSSSEEPFDHPAPELPLTAQEQMLLRIAYGDRPLQVASLKRFILIRSSDDETDFDKFFEPYTTPLTEGNPQ